MVTERLLMFGLFHLVMNVRQTQLLVRLASGGRVVDGVEEVPIFHTFEERGLLYRNFINLRFF